MPEYPPDDIGRHEYFSMPFSQSLQHLLRENEPLAPLNWLQLGGPAKYYAEPSSVEEMCQLLQDAHAGSIPVRILGGGSNILVREAGFDGLVLNLSHAQLGAIAIQGNSVVAGGGALLNHVVSQAAGAGLAGIEYLAGIPGTFGGAVVSNAGVKNGDLGSKVQRVKIADMQGQISDLGREQLQFGFHRSNLAEVVVVEAELELEPGDAADITRRMQSAWIIKRAAQPALGSRTIQAFVEPDAASLSDVFERAGVRGQSDGEVALSPQFPGFVTVGGNASSDQVLRLIERVAVSVEAQTGVQLRSQVRIW